MPIQVTCAECGATVTKPAPSAVRERNYCDHICLGQYRSKHYVGARGANWKGGTKSDRGRVLIYRPDHPSAQRNGYVYRYRLVAEEMIGRPLRKGEVVHHVDGDETNDHPDNLLVLSQSQHARHFDARRPALNAIPDRCGNGHELTLANLRTYQRGHLRKWSCRECVRAAGRRFDAKRRGKVLHAG